jgi:protein SDA1
LKQKKRAEQRKSKVKIRTDFLPIDMLYDPQSAAETLFSKLKKSNDKYEVKLLMLRLVSRLIGRHNLILLQFYPFILRYLNSHEKEKIAEIFAMIIESCHDLVPPEDVKPVIERILSNYANEYCPTAHIVIGINTIREILSRMPLALDEGQIDYLVTFRSHKNSSVRAAAKALINFFRDVCPHLLPKKFVGRFTKIDDTNQEINYGQSKVASNVDGVAYLKEGENIAKERILTEKDFKKIKLQKLREAARRVDKKGFASESESAEEEGIEEEGEGEMSEEAESMDEENWESEMSGEDAEDELSDEDPRILAER